MLRLGVSSLGSTRQSFSSPPRLGWTRLPDHCEARQQVTVEKSHGRVCYAIAVPEGDNLTSIHASLNSL